MTKNWTPFKPTDLTITSPQTKPTRKPPNVAQRALLALARATFLRRGLFRASVARLVFLLGGNRPVDISFRGATFRLHGDANLIEYGLMLHPDYNGADLDFIVHDMPPDGVFLDLGSNIGLYAVSVGHHLSADGRVIAVDVNPKMINRLSQNAALSELDNIEIIHSAVSDKPGNADLMIRKNDEAIVRIAENPDGLFPVKTVESILAACGAQRLDAIKADIEGHEDKALVPFLDNAPAHLLPRRIVIEHPSISGDYAGCTAAFDRHGYILKGRSQQNSFYERTKPAA